MITLSLFCLAKISDNLFIFLYTQENEPKEGCPRRRLENLSVSQAVTATSSLTPPEAGRARQTCHYLFPWPRSNSNQASSMGLIV